MEQTQPLTLEQSETATSNAHNIIGKLETVRDGSTEYTLSLPIDYVEQRIKAEMEKDMLNAGEKRSAEYESARPSDGEIECLVKKEKEVEASNLNKTPFGSDHNSVNGYGIYESQNQRTPKTIEIDGSRIINPDYIQTVSIQAIEQGDNPTPTH